MVAGSSRADLDNASDVDVDPDVSTESAGACECDRGSGCGNPYTSGHLSLLTYQRIFLAIDPDVAFTHDDLDEDTAMVDGCHTTEATLVQPPLLEIFGLAVNTEVKVLTCTVCMTGLPPTEWLGHLRGNHSKALKRLKRQFSAEFESMDTVISELRLASTEEAARQPPGRAPVEGIEVRIGFLCPVVANGSVCGDVAGTLLSFNTHLSKHKDANKKPSMKEREGCTCDYQTIFAGKHRKLFRVHTGRSRASPVGPYELFLRGVNSATPHAVQTEPIQTRELPSLLRVTHWDVFVGPFRSSPKDVVDLVNFPSYGDARGNVEEKKLCLLYHVSKSWLDKVYEVWKVSSPSVRRILGTA